jgi:hypothetical protein
MIGGLDAQTSGGLNARIFCDTHHPFCHCDNPGLVRRVQSCYQDADTASGN